MPCTSDMVAELGNPRCVDMVGWRRTTKKRVTSPCHRAESGPARAAAHVEPAPKIVPRPVASPTELVVDRAAIRQPNITVTNDDGGDLDGSGGQRFLMPRQ